MSRKLSKKYSGVYKSELKNGDVSYYITYNDEYGKKIWEKIGKKSNGINEALCHQERSKRIVKISLGEEVDKKGKKKLYTFKMAYEDYIEWVKLEKKTWVNDETYFIKHLNPTLGAIQISDLESSDFEIIKSQKIKEGYAPATVRGILSTARQIFNYVIRMKKIKGITNPISNGKVRMPKVNNKKLGFFKTDQIEELFDRLKQQRSPLIYNLSLILLHTGARLSEVTSLVWHDINFDNNLIYFKETKEGNARHIVMSKPLRALIQDLYDNRINQLVIPGRKGVEIKSMPKQWQIIVDEMIPGNKTAGKYRLTPHSLRHTHASWLALAGMDIRHIQDQLGHRTLEMTERYSHLIPDRRYVIVQKEFENVK